VARKSWLLWTTGVALLVMASACSSSSGGSSASPAAAAAPIKVGLLCTCSGPFGGNLQAAEDGYVAWVKTTNASGGINGHQIDLITENDQGTPGLALSNAQTIVSDKVDAIVDMDELDTVWAKTVQASNIPVVGESTDNATFYTYSDFYPESGTADYGQAATVAALKAGGATNVGLVYCAEAPVCAQAVPLLKAAGKKIGVPLVYSAAISATAPNYTAQCLAAKQAGVTAFDLADAPAVDVLVAQDCEQVNYHPLFSIPGIAFSPLITASKSLSQSLYAAYADVPLYSTIPAVRQMNAAYDKYFPGLRKDYATTDYSQHALQAWASGLLLADAVKAGGLTPTGTPSAAEIVRGLESLKGDTLDGMAPPLTFPAGKPHPIHCAFEGNIVKGVTTVGNNGKAICQNGS
jgi:branched-chain amino acid transport system substrate-binding protein